MPQDSQAGTGPAYSAFGYLPKNEDDNNLTEQDYKTHAACFIDKTLVAESRLFRVDDLTGSELVGRGRNANVSYEGIAYPYFMPPNYDAAREYRLRRDTPDYDRDSNGEIKETGKYLSPPGRSNMLFIPPGLTEFDFANLRLPCVVVEGEKKALALCRLARFAGSAFPFMPVGLSGVWNWRGKAGKTTASDGKRVSVKTAIQDLDLIKWSGRDAIILFDTNVNTNDSVWKARQALAFELTRRGASVLFAELPEGCSVNGIDDYLGAIEQQNGLETAVSTGVEMLRNATPFREAKPIFPDPPRPLDQTLRAVAELDPDCLPSVLRDWLCPASAVIGCPLDFLVLSAIAIAGSLIGARVRVKPLVNSNWFVVPNLYAGIVGKPSTKKSPALDEARKPLLRLQTEANKRYGHYKSDYEIEFRFCEKADKEARNKSKTVEEYKSNLALLDKPVKPVLRRFEINDATSQKVMQFLADNPNGLILTRDELTGWLTSLDAEYDQSSRAFYLELWKGGITYDHSRVSENRELHLSSGTLSIIGGIQPSKLQRYISEAYSSDSADGFPQRLIFSYPDVLRSGKRASADDYGRMERGLENACNTFRILAERQFGGRALSDSGDSFQPITFDAAAQNAFDEWRDENEAAALRKEEEDEVFASFLIKLPKNCAAVALIFHCLENIDAHDFPDQIKIDTVVRALAYIEVMTTHAERVFALGENRIFSLAQTLIGKIKLGKVVDGFTVRDLKRKGWAGLQTTEIINDVLALLEDYGYLKSIDTSDGPGRPTAKYFVHPSIRHEAQDEVGD